MRRRLSLFAAVTLASCAEEPTQRDAPELDAATADVVSDAASADDVNVDARPSDVSPPDGPPPPDAAPPDAAPPPHLDEPRGYVYLFDPITDRRDVTEVTLPPTTTLDGHLKNDAVDVSNCLKEPGGPVVMPFGGITVTLCHEVPVARPAADGHYLHIEPPADEADGNDSFAEVMMYAFVTKAHDYFKARHGVDWLDFPLPAIVNLQFKITPPLPIPGFTVGANGWSEFPNAAYFPRETWEALTAQFGLPPREYDSIIFGQAGHDFSYDASVILHEYTHAVIGTDRLNGRVFDAQGLDDSPRAMNEGLADYFAASLQDMAIVGKYGIGKLQSGGVRDLARPMRCPNDLLNEIHADGRILGSALWALREAFGADLIDAVVFGALTQFGDETTFQQAGELIVAEVSELVSELPGDMGPAIVDRSRAILTEFGVLDCERVKEWEGWNAGLRSELLPYMVAGKGEVGRLEAVPGFHQWYVDVPPLAAGVELKWDMQPAGGFGGVGGGSGDLDLAIRFGELVTFGYAAGLQVTEDARALVDGPMPQPEGFFSQGVTLTGACLPADGGRIYLALINKADAPAAIVRMSRMVHQDSVAEGAAPSTDCGAER